MARVSRKRKNIPTNETASHIWRTALYVRLSVEDNGKGVSYNVYVFNIQPGVEIDYATGESKEAEQKDTSEKADEIHYILNTNTKKFHLPDCSSAQKIQAENKESFVGDRQQLMDNGYEPCKSCQP